MKCAGLLLIVLLIFSHGIAHACSILDQKKVQIGTSDGIEGVCSNNGLSISCEVSDEDEISCDGPGGSYSGFDLNSVIYSACGCSSEEERGTQLKEEL